MLFEDRVPIDLQQKNISHEATSLRGNLDSDIWDTVV